VSFDRKAALAKVRAICLKLPAAAEKVSHGQPAFFIEKGKIFAWFLDHHHDSGITAVAVKTGGAEEQDMLIEIDPDLYYKPPYIGPAGWIGIRLDVAATDWAHVADRIAVSWRMVAPRRLLSEAES